MVDDLISSSSSPSSSRSDSKQLVQPSDSKHMNPFHFKRKSEGGDSRVYYQTQKAAYPINSNPMILKSPNKMRAALQEPQLLKKGLQVEDTDNAAAESSSECRSHSSIDGKK